MSYATVEEAAVTVLRTHSDFNEENCVAGTSAPIKKGFERVCRISYGGVQRREISIQAMLHVWSVRVDLYVPWRGEITTMETALAAERQKVIDTYALYPRLNSLSGVTRATVLSGNTPEPLSTKKGAYRGQRMILEVHETITPARID